MKNRLLLGTLPLLVAVLTVMGVVGANSYNAAAQHGADDAGQPPRHAPGADDGTPHARHGSDDAPGDNRGVDGGLHA